MDEKKSNISVADPDGSRFLAPPLIDKAANEEGALLLPVLNCLQQRHQGNELGETEKVWRGGGKKGDKMKRRRRHS